MTLSPTVISDLKQRAVEYRGPLAVVTGISMLLLLVGVVFAIRAAIDGKTALALASGTLAGLGGIGVVVGSVKHRNAYQATALRAGLSPAQAKALADEADEEQGD